VPRLLFAEILRLIAELRPPLIKRRHETLAGHVVKSTRQEECVQMQGKIPGSAPPTTFRAARCADCHSHLVPALRGGRNSVNVHTRSGVIRGIPAESRRAPITYRPGDFQWLGGTVETFLLRP